MAKYIIETVRVIRDTYYVEVNDPVWAEDSICMGELDHFASISTQDEIIERREVSEFPMRPMSEVNGATYKFNYETEDWDPVVRWDLAGG